ncbi:MAG: class II fructose-bisphosphate aldolase [Yonghaparkia sp.]|nr:class II fructose-bisphosphate aldolase [Microcella sp.]
MPSPGAVDPITAARTGEGIGAFNVVLLEHAEAIAEAAEAARRPVVLQISQNCVAYHRRLAPIALATQSIARSLTVPALVHLDHADDLDLVDEAIALGFDSIMFDASQRPYDENVALTRRVADRCHERGIVVEAELGEVGGKDGVHAPGVRTDPGDAARFVEQTGVDWLAVAVGTSHGMTHREAMVDTALIRSLDDRVPVPLVLHGSSGLDDGQLVEAVRAGMTKINISTHLNHLFTDEIRTYFASFPTTVDPRRYVGAGREAMTTEIARLLTLLAGGAAASAG